MSYLIHIHISPGDCRFYNMLIMYSISLSTNNVFRLLLAFALQTKMNFA